MSETECIVRPGCQCQAKHQQDAGGRPIDQSQPLAPPMPVSRTMAKQAIDLLRQMDNIPVGQPSPMRETIHLLERQLDDTQPPPPSAPSDMDIAVTAAAERIAINAQPGYLTTTNRDNIRRVAEDELRRISDTAYRQGVNHAAPISPPSPPPPPAVGNPASTAVCGLPDCDYQATGRTEAEAQAALARHLDEHHGPGSRTPHELADDAFRQLQFAARTVAQLATLIETEMPAGNSREQALWLTRQAQRYTELAVSMTWRTGTTIRHHMANAAADT